MQVLTNDWQQQRRSPEAIVPGHASDCAAWQDVTACPACGSAAGTRESLFNQNFYLHNVPAPPPGRTVHLVRCDGCGLVFKDVVPSTQLLSDLTGQVQGGMWHSTYDYALEITEYYRWAGEGPIDILDVGAASGEFLRAIPGQGRKSAMDIMPFDGLQVTGEFITGFLDTPHPRWSGHPYRVVTAFDVLEHLYDPPTALANLAAFVADDGVVIVETGDHDAVPRRGLTSWYYLTGMDHHIAWNKASFLRAADAAGLEVVEFVRKPHKLDHELPGGVRPLLKQMMFQALPNVYRALYRRALRPLSIPRRSGATDHFRAVLRRKPR